MTYLDNNPKNLTELLLLIQSELELLFQQNGIAFAYLAGSWVHGQQTWWSDIDVFVSWPHFQLQDSTVRLQQLIDLNVRAEDLTNLDKLEIRVLEKQSIHTQFWIIKEGVLLYERSNEERIKYIEKLLPNYYDHIIWFEDYLSQSLGSR